MRRTITLLCTLLLIASMVPTAVAKPNTIDYKPVEIGDRFRTEEPSRSLIENLEGISADAASAGDGSGEAGAAAIGEEKIWMTLLADGRYGLTYYTLRGVGEHAEVWVQNNLAFPAGDPRPTPVITDEQVAYLLDAFDHNMFPIESAFWTEPDPHTGEYALLSEWGYVPENYYVPADGVDRVVILVSNVQDENYLDPTYPSYIAGFYSSSYELYFDRNVMTIDAYDWGNRVGPNDAPWRPNDGPANDRPFLYEGTFAHEYQHLLHDDIDSDEENWINEGMSDFAEYLTGYTDLNTDGHINAFLEHPYNSLVNWEDQGGLEVLADYGAAYLMQLYLNQLYGQEFIKALAYNPENGIAGVDSTLAQLGIRTTFADIYRDWSTAVLVNGKVKKYEIEGLSKRVVLDDEGDNGPDALPWGPNYIRIEAQPKITNVMIEGIQFLPSPWSSVADPLDASNRVLYSGGGDLADNLAILPVDLTGQSGSTLSFKTLYDIEEYWDFAFVQVSTDGGRSWTTLANDSTITETDPSAHPDIIAKLPGLTGLSDGWVDMSFDLSAYDGQQILVGFRYMTDWASQGNGALAAPGWYIDDIQVGAYTSDGSSMEGFQGLDEILGRFADYMITFVGKKKSGNGNWQVMHLDMQNFSEGTQKELKKFISNSAIDELIVIVTYAAPQGTQSPAPFDLKVERRSEVPAKNKNNNGKKK